MTLRLVVPQPGAVTLAEAKTHCRVAGSYDDAAISSYIVAATEHVQRMAGVAFGPQVWEATYDDFPVGSIDLGHGPVIDVLWIMYRDENSEVQTLSSDAHELIEAAPDGVIAPTGVWPATDGTEDSVVVQFTAGLEDGAPSEIKQAVLLLVGHWYEHREAAAEKPLAEIPFAVSALVGLHRRMFV